MWLSLTVLLVVALAAPSVPAVQDEDAASTWQRRGEDDGRQAGVVALLEWAESLGAKGVGNVRYGSSVHGGATLLARRPTAAGKVLVSIPLEMLLTDAFARSAPSC